MLGTIESIPKSFIKYLRNTPGKHNIMGLQNTASLDTAHVQVTGTVVMHKYKTFIVRNNITFTNCYSPRLYNVSAIKHTVISLNNIKIISKFLLSRLTPYAEVNIGDYQREFRRNRSATDHIFCVCQLLELNWNIMSQCTSYL
jgi:hypothetical protein